MLIFVFLLLEPAWSEHLQSFNSTFILEYFKATNNISEICHNSLLKVDKYLNSTDLLLIQRKFFFESYAIGDATYFDNRDINDWSQRYYKCINTADETAFSISEYPLIYCTTHLKSQRQTIAVGVCLPAPCLDDRAKMVAEWARSSTDQENLSIVQQTLMCTKSRFDTPWYKKPAALIDFSVNKIILAIVSCVTVYHLQRGDSAQSLIGRAFISFSAIKNLKRIAPKEQSKDSLMCLFGMRFLTTVFVIIGHSSIFIQNFISDVDAYRADFLHNIFLLPMTNAMLCVDTFFVIGGTLVSYNWFYSLQKQGEAPKWSSFAFWLKFYRHRILRYLPVYIYSISLISQRLSASNFRPIWHLNDQTSFCNHNWWKNLLFINSLTDNLCLPWTWYIGTDFIFYLISPVYLLALYNSATAGLIISLFTILLSSVFNIGQTIRYNLPPTQMLWINPAMFNQDYMLQHRLTYIKPEYRVAPYIIGVLLGYIISKQTHNIKHLSTATATVAWIVSIILGFFALFGHYPALKAWDWYYYHLFYAGFHRCIWSIFIAWVIYACHNGFGGVLNRFLSLPIFQPLSANSFATYMLHMFAVATYFERADFPIPYVGAMKTLLKFIFQQILTANAVGFYALMTIELPAQNLVKIFLSRHNEKLIRANKSCLIKQNECNSNTSTHKTTGLPQAKHISNLER